jgi:hypothetical protein
VVKQGTHDTTKKLQGLIIVEVAEELTKKEEEVKVTVATSKETFHNFLATKLVVKGEQK